MCGRVETDWTIFTFLNLFYRSFFRMSFHHNLLYLCYISVLTIGLASARLKRGYYPNLIDFCANDEVYVGIPWNCHGYLHCQNANGLKMPFWIDCPASLYYNYGSKTCTWPQNVSQPCPSTGGEYNRPADYKHLA